MSYSVENTQKGLVAPNGIGSICGMIGGHTNMAIVAAGLAGIYLLFFRKKKG